MAPPPSPPPATRLFGRGSWPEVRRITDNLRAETVGGRLLVGAAIIALVWANSAPSAARATALRALEVDNDATWADPPTARSPTSPRPGAGELPGASAHPPRSSPARSSVR